MSKCIYLLFGSEGHTLSFEQCPTLSDNGYLIQLQLTNDGVGLQQLTINRPSVQLAMEVSLQGFESCLPNPDCSLRRQIDLLNSSLTNYQKRVALECFNSEGRTLFNSFLIGLCYVLTAHALCYGGYTPFANAKLSGSLIQSITRNNAYIFLRYSNSLLDPFDTNLVNGYRNFWRVWAGCFERGEFGNELEDLAMWVNGEVEDSVSGDCSQMFVDRVQLDDIFIASPIRRRDSPHDSPDSPPYHTPPPSPRGQLDLNPLFSELDQYRAFMGEMVNESRVIQLENLVKEVQASILDLDAKVDRLTDQLNECDERIDTTRKECLSKLDKEPEVKECCNDERLAVIEKQFLTYTRLLKDLAFKIGNAN